MNGNGVSYWLELTHDCMVNFMMGSNHIYYPNRKAGDHVACGTFGNVRDCQRHYAAAGYGTRIVRFDRSTGLSEPLNAWWERS